MQITKGFVAWLSKGRFLSSITIKNDLIKADKVTVFYYLDAW